MIHLLGMASPNVVKVMIMLEEVGLPWRFSFVDVYAGEQFEPAFRALNPNSKTPVIVDETDAAAPVTVFESGAILIYLAEKYGTLLPHAAPARSAVLQWLMLQMGSFGPTSGQAIHFGFVTDQDSYGRTRFSTEFQRLVGVVEAQLASHAHIAGPDYSVADIAFFPWFRTLANFFPDQIDRPHIARWRAEVAARPAVERAIAFAVQVAEQDRGARRAATPEQMDRYFGRTKPTEA